jgi:surface antigen
MKGVAICKRVGVAAAAALSFSLAACANEGEYTSASYEPYESTAARTSPSFTQEASIEVPDRPLQCVPYARAISGVDLHGDAANWWDLAAGRYERSNEPSLGAVLVLTGSSHHGHVAVVTAVDSSRQIRIDHANWLNDGRIYHNDPVIDVSPDNDWSEVKVWDARDKVMGSRTYLVRGFISPAVERQERVASRN